MVLIALPPPAIKPRPRFYTLQPGVTLVRLFDPTSPWHVGPLTFTQNGPRNRFDHHRSPPAGHPSGTWDDPDRSIYYCALTLSCCLVEVFGDTHIIDRPQLAIAMPIVTRPLRLLDLCANGAMRAGSVAALCATADRKLSQAWSRYFYEDPVFRKCDGIRYHNAHNNEKAFALYERAADGLDCPPGNVISITEPRLRPEVMRIALKHNMNLMI